MKNGIDNWKRMGTIKSIGSYKVAYFARNMFKKYTRRSSHHQNRQQQNPTVKIWNVWLFMCRFSQFKFEKQFLLYWHDFDIGIVKRHSKTNYPNEKRSVGRIIRYNI